MTWTIYINFRPPSQAGSTKNLALIGKAVSEEKMFEIVAEDGRTDDGWTPEHGYTISSPCEPEGSGELKRYLTFAPSQSV